MAVCLWGVEPGTSCIMRLSTAPDWLVYQPVDLAKQTEWHMEGQTKKTKNCPATGSHNRSEPDGTLVQQLPLYSSPFNDPRNYPTKYESDGTHRSQVLFLLPLHEQSVLSLTLSTTLDCPPRTVRSYSIVVIWVVSMWASQFMTHGYQTRQHHSLALVWSKVKDHCVSDFVRGLLSLWMCEIYWTLLCVYICIYIYIYICISFFGFILVVTYNLKGSTDLCLSNVSTSTLFLYVELVSLKIVFNLFYLFLFYMFLTLIA